MTQRGGESNGIGPGSPGDSPFAVRIPADKLPGAIQQAVGGDIRLVRNDLGAQPPGDPLKAPSLKEQAGRDVYRDLPVITVQNNWKVEEVRNAIAAHMMGMFELSGQLVDSIIGDDRVQATLGSRISGLFGRPEIFTPANDSAAAKEVLDAWVAHWPQFAAVPAMTEMSAYEILMGWSPAQLVWDTSGPVWLPYQKPWHTRYTYYNWPLRKYVALSQDGPIAIQPGNGKWILHSRHTDYRAWIWGAIRPVSEPWLYRHFSAADWANYCEVHGVPIKKAIVPASSDEVQRDRYQQQLAAIGGRGSIMVSRGVVGTGQDWDLEFAEPKDTSWECFPGLIDRADMQIVLALLFQNLTTEVKGGSFAATSAHMDIRQQGIQADNSAWRLTIHNQVARPFAQFNFGDASLAPWSEWDAAPREDHTANADAFGKLATAMQGLAAAGVKFKDPTQVRQWAGKAFGLRELPEFEIADPPAAVTAKAASSTAEASHKSGDASLISAAAAKTKAEKPEPVKEPPSGEPKD